VHVVLVAQRRFAVFVFGCVSYSSTAHTLSGVHTRFVCEVGAALWYSLKKSHVVHSEQVSAVSVVLVLGLKVLGAQASHWRSLLAEAAMMVRKPAPHALLTAWHALLSSVLE
jgi:hypothetical protein